MGASRRRVSSGGRGEAGRASSSASTLPRSLEKEKALDRLYALLGYVAVRGPPIKEGDTVGSDATERLPVHHVKSPFDPSKTVWRVELPEKAAR